MFSRRFASPFFIMKYDPQSAYSLLIDCLHMGQYDHFSDYLAEIHIASVDDMNKFVKGFFKYAADNENNERLAAIFAYMMQGLQMEQKIKEATFERVLDENADSIPFDFSDFDIEDEPIQ